MRWHERLGTRLLVPILAVLVLSFLTCFGWLAGAQRDDILARSRSQAASLSAVVRASLRAQMLRRSAPTLEETVAAIHSETDELRVTLLDKTGRVVVAHDPAQRGRTMEKTDPSCVTCHIDGTAPLVRSVVLDTRLDGRWFRSVNPIPNDADCRTCHGDASRYLGVLIVDKNMEADERFVAEGHSTLFTIGGVTIVFVAGLVFVIVHALVRVPMRELIAGALAVQRGGFGTTVEVRTRGEMRDLASAFNDMSLGIRARITEIEAKSFELSMLYSMVEKLSRVIEIRELHAIVLDMVADVFHDVDFSLLAVQLRPDGDLNLTSRRTGDDDLAHWTAAPTADAFLPYVPQELAAQWLAGALLDTAAADVDQARAKVVPFAVGDRRLGLLYVQKRQAWTFTPAENQLADALRSHISVALENARLYSVAITDELTQAYTLRYFHTAIEGTVERFKRYGQKATLLMLDLDNFKSINDRHGHQAGDAVLRQTTTSIQRTVRATDLVCRYGGEEFAIVLPESDEKAAAVVAERIRSTIEALSVSYRDISLRATASIGAAAIPLHATSVKELVHAADQALYRAKRLGKNQVVMAETSAGADSA